MVEMANRSGHIADAPGYRSMKRDSPSQIMLLERRVEPIPFYTSQ
jgi:hypothetical protein